MAEDETFSGRWSRRKTEARAPEAEPPAAPDVAESEPGESEEDIVAALPPVEELEAESDYTPFLDRRVPRDLRRMALRKLWISDPVLANLDGLNDYDDDFRTMGLGKVVRTAYEVGRGMVTRAEKEAELAAARIKEAADTENAGDDAPNDHGADADAVDHDAETGGNQDA